MKHKDNSYYLYVSYKLLYYRIIFRNFLTPIPNKMSESFNTYLCFKFTYLGIYLCRIMEKIEKIRK